MRDKILDHAIEQFTRFGVRSVTMDDIARNLGISKKTIYQDFTDKKDLVNSAFRKMLSQDHQHLSAMLDGEDGVIENLLYTSQAMRERMTDLNPMVIIEIQKYYPETWGIFQDFKENVIRRDIFNVLEKGKKLGYFRPEIDSDILSRIRVNQINSVFESQEFRDGTIKIVDVQLEMMDHFLHGIFTEKGREAYKSKKENNPTDRVL
ncbi:TetR/AcrR family transcriptional regulator [Algoriphagus namhaensis]|uniref:TetR/AcrR family transcriptional regulator n=1 Tax=Algoriphagus namhaensis TaxID=915353 RepID=A0ABV8AUN2_9BACT